MHMHILYYTIIIIRLGKKSWISNKQHDINFVFFLTHSQNAGSSALNRIRVDLAGAQIMARSQHDLREALSSLLTCNISHFSEGQDKLASVPVFFLACRLMTALRVTQTALSVVALTVTVTAGVKSKSEDAIAACQTLVSAAEPDLSSLHSDVIDCLVNLSMMTDISESSPLELAAVSRRLTSENQASELDCLHDYADDLRNSPNDLALQNLRHFFAACTGKLKCKTPVAVATEYANLACSVMLRDVVAQIHDLGFFTDNFGW